MVANIIRDFGLIGKEYSATTTGTKSVACGTSLVLTLTGTNLPAGVYYVYGFINVTSASNTGFYQAFIEYNGEWLDAAGSYADSGKIYQKEPKTFISHDGSTNISLYLNVSDSSTSNNINILSPYIKAIRIA